MRECISESEWKPFRNLRPVILGRFCGRVVDELDAIGRDPAPPVPL
jgi:hypothetical protein